MPRLAVLSATLLVVTIHSATNAEARVTVIGCPRLGIEVNCLVIRGQDTTNYDISSAQPRPQPNDRVIQLTGTKTHKFGICMQGIILSDITWTYTDTRCPER